MKTPTFTCLKYRKKLEYWPASGRYESNTVMHIGRTVGSFLTFFRDCKTKEQSRYWNICTNSNESIKKEEDRFPFFVHAYTSKQLHMEIVKLKLKSQTISLYTVWGIQFFGKVSIKISEATVQCQIKTIPQKQYYVIVREMIMSSNGFP